jgi:uncharacterized membrane protein YccC
MRSFRSSRAMPSFSPAILVHQLDRAPSSSDRLKVVARNVAAEDAPGQMVVLEQRRAGKADEGRVGQRQAHVARQLARLGPVRLVGNRR